MDRGPDDTSSGPLLLGACIRTVHPGSHHLFRPELAPCDSGAIRCKTVLVGTGRNPAMAYLMIDLEESAVQDDLDQLHADLETAYNDAKSKLDAMADEVSDDDREIYEKAKADLESLRAELESHRDVPAAEAKHWYRSLQHLLRHITVDIRIMAKDDDADAALHDLHHAVTEAHNKIDHIIDRL